MTVTYTPEQRQATLLGVGALLEGHFLLTSGRHSSRYFQAMRLLERPLLCDDVAEQVLADAISGGLSVGEVTAVVSPAVGGIVWGQAIARAVSRHNDRDSRAIFAERVEGVLMFRRGFELSPKDTVLLSEDVLTTGGTVRELGSLTTSMGATIAGVAAVADRSRGTHGLPWPVQSWVTIEASTWDEDECPLCAEGSRPTKPGSRGFQ